LPKCFAPTDFAIGGTTLDWINPRNRKPQFSFYDNETTLPFDSIQGAIGSIGLGFDSQPSFRELIGFDQELL
jgi:hypothetical protein